MFKPRTFVVPLYGGDYQQRIAQAEQKVAEAEQREKDGKTPPRLMNDPSEVEQAIAEHNALVEQAEADGCTKVTLRALGRKRWNEMVEAHPPRTDESVGKEKRDLDESIGVNDDTFGEALLAVSIESVSDDTTPDDLLEAVSSAQYDLLYRTAFALNRDGGPRPQLLTPPSQSGAEIAS